MPDVEPIETSEDSFYLYDLKDYSVFKENSEDGLPCCTEIECYEDEVSNGTELDVLCTRSPENGMRMGCGFVPKPYWHLSVSNL